MENSPGLHRVQLVGSGFESRLTAQLPVSPQTGKVPSSTRMDG